MSRGVVSERCPVCGMPTHILQLASAAGTAERCFPRSKLLLVPLLFGLGCSTFSHRPIPNDPLVSDIAPGTPSGPTELHGTTPALPPSSSPPGPTAGLPSVPPATLTLTPAALASGVQQTVNPNSPYILAGNPGGSTGGTTPVDAGSVLNGARAAMPGNDAAPVVLGGDIVPHDPTGTAPHEMTPAPGVGALGSITTWDQALAVLKARQQSGHVLWWDGPKPALGNDEFSFKMCRSRPWQPQ